MNILVVVDVQEDFCPGGSLAVPGGHEVVPVINRLLESPRFDLRIGTRDSHPEDHVSFAKYGRHCVKGTSGAEFHSALRAELFDHVVEKGVARDVESLSAFLSEDRKVETGLRAILERAIAEKGADRKNVKVFFTGLAGDICVFLTAMDGHNLGYDCYFIVDATRPLDLPPGSGLEALRTMARAGINLIESREVLGGREIERSAAIGQGIPV